MTHQVADPSASPRAAPTLRVLTGLTLAVLIGHWLALGGRVPFWPDHWFKSHSTMGALPTQDPAQTSQPSTADAAPAMAEMPAPVTSSTVRWIVPDPPKPPPPPKPKPKPRPKPAPAPVITAPAPPQPDPLEVERVIEAMSDPEPAPTNQDLLQDLAPPAPPATPTQTETAVAPAEVVANPVKPKGDPGPVLPLGSLPPDATLSYKVEGKAKGLPYHAGGELTWHQTGETYQAELSVSMFLFGSFSQRSNGAITAHGLAPAHFYDRRRSSEKAAHFEAATGRIRYSSNAPDAPLMPGAQDQLSVTLQLGALLNAHPDAAEGAVLTLPVSSVGSSDVRRFRVGPLTTLSLPAGDVIARLLTGEPRQPYDKTTLLWLAPSLGNLPVRIRLNDVNGDFLDMLLDSMPEIAAPASAPPQTNATP